MSRNDDYTTGKLLDGFIIKISINLLNSFIYYLE